MKTAADTEVRVPEQLRLEAQAWLRCMRSGKATEEDAQAFLRWRSSGPVHLAAFVEAQRCWDALNPAIDQLLQEDASQATSRYASNGPAWGRRAFLGGAVGAAALAGAAFVYPPFRLWPAAGELRADYRTGTGEQRQIALTDHVSVSLNTLTSITRQDVAGRMAGIELISGEAAVDLQSASRGFSVTAGAGRSVAGTGRFEVRHTDASSCVTCVQGLLRVEHPLGTRTLQSGQQVIYTAHSLGETASVDLAAVSAWRKGVLVFHLTPLTQVVDEINRYRPGRVVLLNSNVRGREMSGYFSIRSLDAVLSQIQRTYGLSARKLPGGLLLLS
jgi:transmembrane sensor